MQKNLHTCSGKVRHPVQSLPCTETQYSSRVLQKLTFRLWHTVPMCKTSQISLLWEWESLSSRSIWLSVIFPRVRQWFLLWPCHFTGNEQYGPVMRNMLAVNELHGKRLQVSAGHWVKDKRERREKDRTVKTCEGKLNKFEYKRVDKAAPKEKPKEMLI